jgi:murein DD-endopeptidase MepM/ murein hydrolase activator NlpD
MGAATAVAMLGFHLAAPRPTPGVVSESAEEAGSPTYLEPPGVSRAQPLSEHRPPESAVQPPPATVEPLPLTGDSRFWGLGADELSLPIGGLRAEDLHDTFKEARGGGERTHEALDIMAPRGTPVLAMVDGPVKKLFDSKAGGLTVYQFGTDETYCYYYAHLDRYAGGLAEGKTLQRGEVLGYVGSTGNASPDAPHLHLGIYRLGPEKNWWQGTPVNPFPILKRLAERQNREAKASIPSGS